MEVTKTPYEEYLRQSITDERARLDSLYDEFAKSNPVRKQMLKRQIDEAIQNIELLSNDLDKYRNGLSWLREPSKERDEKAEHLPRLEKEAPSVATPAKPAASAGQPAKPVVARPTIGKPIGSSPAPATSPAPAAAPRPAVGTPVGSPRPRIGTPVGTPVAKSSNPQTPPAQNQQQQQSPAQGQQTVQKPVIGTPVKRPVIGTPIGKLKPTQDASQQGEASKDSGDNGNQQSA